MLFKMPYLLYFPKAPQFIQIYFAFESVVASQTQHYLHIFYYFCLHTIFIYVYKESFTCLLTLYTTNVDVRIRLTA